MPKLLITGPFLHPDTIILWSHSNRAPYALPTF